MYTSMTSALSLLLLALIPATIAAPPPSSSVVPPIASSTVVSVPLPRGTGISCPSAGNPVFPVPGSAGAVCSTEGAKACTVDETSVLVCTGGKWVATACGQKDGYQLACRSYANLIMANKCPSYGPVYTECTGYEDGDVHETVSSQIGWDAQATRAPIQPTATPAAA